ncbi:MAG: ABC transporter permease [Candidatus Bathyarchaeia archaeon]
MGFKAYILKKAFYSILLIFLVSTLNFIIFRLMPGDPYAVMIREYIMTPEMIDEVLNRWGLRKPLWEQYLLYMVNLFQGNFGISFRTFRPVQVEIMERLPNTIALVSCSVIASTILQVLIGFYIASRRGKLSDSIILSTGIVLNSTPVFWLGMTLLYFFSFHYHIFPAAGTTTPPPNNPKDPISFIIDYLWHMALPFTALTAIILGGGIISVRNLVLDALSQDFVVVARAKGLKERDVLYRHVFKNVQLPIVTSAAISIARSVGGAMTTETVFTWYGMGRYTFESISNLDYPSLQGIFFVICVLVIVANFIVDVIYGILDPRVKYGESAG